MGEAELHFNKKEAFEYSERMGYPFKKSKFYNDLKYVPRVGNKFSKIEIDKYIKDKIIGTSGAAVDGDKKAQLEIENLEEDLRKKKFKNDIDEGKYIPLSEAEIIHSSKLQHLFSAMEGFFQSKISAMIEKCKGNMEQEQELRSFCLKEFTIYFDEYAKPCQYIVPLAISKVEDKED